MKNTLRELLTQQEQQERATQTGTHMHTLMQHIVVDKDIVAGDSDIVQKIQSRPDLIPFFSKTAQTEVPVAGYINDKFISRRIDRMCIDDNAKTITILDYKTDLDRNLMREHYVAQLGEYVTLMRMIYPDYNVSAFILWLHDWTLEKIH